MNQHYIDLITDLQVDLSEIKLAIETGTHRGNGARAFATLFDLVFTIEISEDLFRENLKESFQRNIIFYLGKSPEVLKEILEEINMPYLLFLDAHGSGGDTDYDRELGRYGSPVLQELEAVKCYPPSIILIDDLEDFDKINTYPRVDQIIEKVSELGDYKVDSYYSKGMKKGVLYFK